MVKRLFRRAKGQNRYGYLKTGKIRTFPLKASTRLVYNTIYSTPTDSTAHNITGFSMRGNDMYDPDPSIGGHQPTGFDEMIALGYYNFIVYASKITIRLFGCDTNGKNLHMYVWPDKNTLAGSYPSISMDQMWSNPQIKYKYQGSIYGGNDYKKLTYYCKTKKFYPNKDLVDDWEGFGGNAISSPGHVWYWNVAFASDFTTSTVRAQVNVRYYAKWWNPNPEILPLS